MLSECTAAERLPPPAFGDMMFLLRRYNVGISLNFRCPRHWLVFPLVVFIVRDDTRRLGPAGLRRSRDPCLSFLARFTGLARDAGRTTGLTSGRPYKLLSRFDDLVIGRGARNGVQVIEDFISDGMWRRCELMDRFLEIWKGPLKGVMNDLNLYLAGIVR